MSDHKKAVQHCVALLGCGATRASQIVEKLGEDVLLHKSPGDLLAAFDAPKVVSEPKAEPKKAKKAETKP